MLDVEGKKNSKLFGGLFNLHYICRKIEMSNDIFESVSQGSSGEETAENSRIYEIADELRRRCQLYEAQLRDSQGDVKPTGFRTTRG